MRDDFKMSEGRTGLNLHDIPFVVNAYSSFHTLQSFHMIVFSYCSIFILQSFHIVVFSYCSFFILKFFILQSFHIVVFSYCGLFILLSLHIIVFTYSLHIVVHKYCSLHLLQSIHIVGLSQLMSPCNFGSVKKCQSNIKTSELFSETKLYQLITGEAKCLKLQRVSMATQFL